MSFGNMLISNALSTESYLTFWIPVISYASKRTTYGEKRVHEVRKPSNGNHHTSRGSIVLSQQQWKQFLPGVEVASVPYCKVGSV